MKQKVFLYRLLDYIFRFLFTLMGNDLNQACWKQLMECLVDLCSGRISNRIRGSICFENHLNLLAACGLRFLCNQFTFQQITDINLFVNKKQVSLGPARGDLGSLEFLNPSIISAFLQIGKNIVTAQVWNEGEWRAEGQISLRTGFILSGEGVSEILNTNKSWKCIHDRSIQATSL